MSNPFVQVDLTSHPRYSSDYYSWLAKVCDAEVLMLNTNKGTMRVRLLDPLTNEVVVKSTDIDMCYIVEDEVTVSVR